MELRDYITNETSALVERLVAASETAARQVRLEADEAVGQLRGETEQLRAELQAAVSRAEAVAAQLATANDRVTSLTTRLDTENERASALAAGFEAETERASTLTAQLEAETRRARTLAAQVDAEAARAAGLQAQLEAETERASALAAQLETENARVVALAADLDGANASLRQAEAARTKAESDLETTAAELLGVRELLEAARAQANRASEAFQSEAAEKALLQQAHQTAAADLKTQLDAALAEMSTLRASLTGAEARANAATGSQTQVHTLQEQLEHQTEMLREKDARLEAAEAAVASMRAEVNDANAISDATSAEMTAMRERMRRVTAMLNDSAASLDALGGATTVNGVFGILMRQLAAEFQRVAIFRVKGNHLEGELATGLDDSVDINKIVIPLGLRSVITKAKTSGKVEQATKEQIDESRSPFGGSPASALAAPLVFEGEVLAVAYADSDTLFSDAHGGFAGMLVRHANAVLAGLGPQLKAARQLREYARTLLHEAETIFAADLEAGVPEHERLQRLRHSIKFAQDLYAQRAALEAPLSIDALEEEIAALGRDPLTPFAESLAAIRQDRSAQRTA